MCTPYVHCVHYVYAVHEQPSHWCKKHIPGVGSLPNQHISIAFSLGIRNTVWFGYLENDDTMNFARNPVM